MLGRIDPIDAAAEHRDRLPAGVQRAQMCGAVDPARETADDHDAGAGEIATQLVADAQPGRRRGARTHHRHRRLRQNRVIPLQPEEWGRIHDLLQQRRICRAT